MKLLLLLTAFLATSTRVSAQVITGGAIVGPQMAFASSVKSLNNLENHLVKKHPWCPSAGIKLSKTDLMDSYLKLAFLRSTRATAASCDQANAYLKCLNDERTVELVDQIKNDKAALLLIMGRYKISKSKANQILDFFANLDKKIE